MEDLCRQHGLELAILCPVDGTLGHRPHLRGVALPFVDVVLGRYHQRILCRKVGDGHIVFLDERITWQETDEFAITLFQIVVTVERGYREVVVVCLLVVVADLDAAHYPVAHNGAEVLTQVKELYLLVEMALLLRQIGIEIMRAPFIDREIELVGIHIEFLTWVDIYAELKVAARLKKQVVVSDLRNLPCRGDQFPEIDWPIEVLVVVVEVDGKHILLHSDALDHEIGLWHWRECHFAVGHLHLDVVLFSPAHELPFAGRRGLVDCLECIMARESGAQFQVGCLIGPHRPGCELDGRGIDHSQDFVVFVAQCQSIREAFGHGRGIDERLLDGDATKRIFLGGTGIGIFILYARPRKDPEELVGSHEVVGPFGFDSQESGLVDAELVVLDILVQVLALGACH